MIANAFRRMMSKPVAILRVVGREPGVSDRGGQGKSRKVRPVGRGREHQQIQITLQTLPMSGKLCDFRQRAILVQLWTPFGADVGR
ncbi:hypothetical protein Bra1253DRAFT_06121 [Bradyrhizobium sp. WSM1253]|nr:hypothetical protein Bra1253DRAFT_06121 [Bradyrhizobium sp. WSM1253]